MLSTCESTVKGRIKAPIPRRAAVYQLSLECGVRRVVAASTNQAAKWCEHPYFAGLKDRVTNARRVIGYEPQDDSEVRFAEDIVRLLHRRT